jgi:hypothetical protein
MPNTKQIKHSKFKNTGILFELLVRQITSEILSGDNSNKSQTIVSKFFNKNTELYKEFRLYELLLRERYNTESRAEKFIDTVCEAYTRLNQDKLRKEKFGLVKEIKEKYDIDKFLSSPIHNYKVLASIYKVFESKVNTNYDVKDIFNSKVTLVENITSTAVSPNTNEVNQLIESYKKQEKDLRLLTYKILVENFNKKYTNLNSAQKNLLKEYINNVSNTSKFKEYVTTELPTIITELKSIHSKIDDKVTKIKLSETVNTLNKMKIGKVVNDNHVSAIMLSYELIKELKGKL